MTDSIVKNRVVLDWRDLLARFALMFFCIALWHKGLLNWATGVLVLAWLVDGGPSRFAHLIREPLVLGVVVFCGVWILGLLWSDFTVAFQGKWRRYFILLTFIPLLSLMTSARLPWVSGALISGYLGILVLGSYQWMGQGMQGVPWLDISYLGYSAALGIGVILAVFFGWVVPSRKNRLLLWLAALLLLFLQFNQSARGLLLATLAALLLMVVLRYRIEGKMLAGGLILITVITALFALNSDIFHERLLQAGTDLRLFQQGDYQTSLGYRLAMWEIGLQGIAEHPVLGHGAGMARQYFEESIVTYKQGVYKNLPEFQETVHFHNEWIEIGIHLGLLGILAFVFLLWCWFQMFKRHQMGLRGGGIICYVFIAGLTHVFLLYNRIPPRLLAVTAVAVCWQKHEKDPVTAGPKQLAGDGKMANS